MLFRVYFSKFQPQVTSFGKDFPNFAKISVPLAINDSKNNARRTIIAPKSSHIFS